MQPNLVQNGNVNIKVKRFNGLKMKYRSVTVHPDLCSRRCVLFSLFTSSCKIQCVKWSVSVCAKPFSSPCTPSAKHSILVWMMALGMLQAEDICAQLELARATVCRRDISVNRSAGCSVWACDCSGHCLRIYPVICVLFRMFVPVRSKSFEIMKYVYAEQLFPTVACFVFCSSRPSYACRREKENVKV